MRFIEFDPAKLSDQARTDWEKWAMRAEEARKKAISDHEADKKLALNQKVWSDLKAWLLLHVFDGKCSYCESRTVATSYGDAEHYRPKSEVSVRGADGKVQIVYVDGQKHPGYFWLAFDWENLIPSCQLCNSGEGKQTQFPIRNVHVHDVSKTTAELDAEEEPLLLHPYPRAGREDPRKSIAFEPLGGVAAQTERGEETIKVCNLQRHGLVEERRAARENVERAWTDALLDAGKKIKPLDQSIAELKEPGRAYSRVWADYVEARLEELKAQIDAAP